MDLVRPRAAKVTGPMDPMDPIVTDAAVPDTAATAETSEARGIPPLFAGLCDDAALFPPGNAAAADAVPAHGAYRTSWYRDLVGPFLAAPKHLPAVAEAVAERDPRGLHLHPHPHEPLPLALVVPDGPDALDSAIKAAASEPGIELVGVELACATHGTSADAARDAAEALKRSLPPGTGGVVEVRRGDGLGAALDVLAATPFRAKLRTGGTVARAFPSEAEVAEFIVGCVARDLPFKCTAGLHAAVRHTDEITGFEHHGFLNILAATGAATQGADITGVASLLAVRSGPELINSLRQLTADDVARTRRAFTAYGTCSIAEPLADLIKLGAL